MIKFKNKINLIIIVIILENLIFTYHRLKEFLFVENLMGFFEFKNIAYVLLVAVVTLIIFIISWYFSFITLFNAKEQLKELNLITDNTKFYFKLKNKYILYIKKFFFIQGITFFFIFIGIEFIVNIFQFIGKFLLNINFNI